MSDYQTIRLQHATDGISTLTLYRAEKHNALNAQMIQEIRLAVAEIESDSSVRVVILAGEGKSFCAGGDLGWMREQADKDREGKMAESSQLALMLRDLDNLSKPLIGRIHGSAYGGGVGMMSVCDLVIANNTIRMGLTETKLGLIPATIGPYVVRRMGEGAARQVFMNGALFDAQRGLQLGLISLVCSPEDLDNTVQKQARYYLQCAPGAVADAKALCQTLARKSDTDQLEYTANQLADRWETTEARDGIGSFFERTTPPWIVKQETD